MKISESPSAKKPARFWRLLPPLALATAALLAAALAFEARRLSEPAATAERFAWGQQETGPLPELWQAPAFSFVDQNGQPSSDRDLSGHVWIADFIYTECTSACPLLSAKLALIRRQLPEPQLTFVSFSVDPEHDKPEVLQRYARTWGAEDPRWRLLSTDPKGLASVADGMRVAVNATNDPSNPILHTTLFFLVDSASKVRGVYDSADDSALKRLVSDARSLIGSSAAPPTDALSGAEAYMDLGCAGCHENPRVAPSLAGLWGQSVPLEGGGSVIADEHYVTASILSPGVQVRAGFLNIMPAYGDRLQGEQLHTLVQYLHDLHPVQASAHQRAAGPSAAGAAVAGTAVAGTAAAGSATIEPARIAIDPICHMQVRVTPDTPHVEHDGKQEYFCSENCQHKFLASLGHKP
jgi:protein SCO1/2